MNVISAIKKGSVTEVRKVLRNDKDNALAVQKDDDDRTPLHHVAEEGNLSILKALLAKKPDINALDCNRWTPLHCAANKANFEVCEELLKSKQIEVSIRNSDDTVPLVYLVRLRNEQIHSKSKQYKRVLKLMVQRGADVNAVNAFGDAPLHAACLRGTTLGVSFLLNNNADVNVFTAKKETALHWVTESPKIEMVKVLMQYSADPFQANSAGVTPMEIAIGKRQKQIITLMTRLAFTCADAQKESAKMGYLHRYTRRGSWEKVYCVLKEYTIYTYRSDDKKEKPISSYDIMESVIRDHLSEKQKRGKPNVFRLTNQLRSTYFSSESDVDCADWVKSIHQGRRIFSRTADSSDPSLEVSDTSTNQSSVLSHEEALDHIQRILEPQANLICADCESGGTFWVLFDYGALVCYDCAMIHKKFNTSIKSIYCDSWTLNEILFLKCNGNAKHNLKMESGLPLTIRKPNNLDSSDYKEQYIRWKYKESLFKDSNAKPSPRARELKHSLANRISKHENIYSIFHLLPALSIPLTTWDNLKQTSTLLRLLQGAMKSDRDDAKIKTILRETLGIVSIHGRELVPAGILFVRTIQQSYSQKEKMPEIKKLLRQVITKYEEQHKLSNDREVDFVFKWWLPQVMEVVSTIQACHENQCDCLRMIELFVPNSVIALYFLSGEYLLYEGEFNLSKLENEEQLVLQAKELKTDFRECTQEVRNLLCSGIKIDNEDKPDASRKNNSLSRMNSTEPYFTATKQTHSWSDQFSPRSEKVFSAMVEVNPILNMFNQVPNTLALISLVTEQPTHVQLNLLGVQFLENHFVLNPSADWENVFGTDSVSLESALSVFHSGLNELRQLWPLRTSKTSIADSGSLLFRKIYVLKIQLESLEYLPVTWSCPDIWQSWQNLLQLTFKGLRFLCACVVLQKDRKFIIEILCSLSVLQKWTISKLKEIQNF